MADLIKVPPNSIESEQCVIGSILSDTEALMIVSEILKVDDFYSEGHRSIYECMLELSEERTPIDIVTISEKLRNRDMLDVVGGMNYLTSTVTMVPTTSNVKTYAEIVREKSILRKLIKASNDIINIGYSDSDNVLEILNLAESNIFKISQERMSNNFNKIGDVLGTVLGQIEEVSVKGSDITGLDTGFADLNSALGGFHDSDLILIAARPAMGKTAFALNLVMNAAIKSMASVAVFSLEMSKEQLVQRLVSSQSHVEMEKISKGRLADEDWKKIMDAMKILSKTDIYIDDTPGIKVSEIRSKCRKLKTENKKLDMVMIDYLQLMEGDGRSESRQQEVSKISRSLKILAKELDCPVVALSQLSRNTENTKDHVPKLSDLRDSGAIEQDADIVMFIYRDEYYHPNDTKKKNIAEIKIAKNRHGETSDVELVWMGHIQKFGDKIKNV